MLSVLSCKHFHCARRGKPYTGPLILEALGLQPYLYLLICERVSVCVCAGLFLLCRQIQREDIGCRPLLLSTLFVQTGFLIKPDICFFFFFPLVWLAREFLRSACIFSQC